MKTIEWEESVCRHVGLIGLEVLRDDGAYRVCRGEKADASRILVVLPSGDYSSADLSRQLEHEYSLRVELDPEWSARPLELIRGEARTMLVLEDPGGEPLDRLIQQPLSLGTKLRIAIGLTAALGKLHELGIVHKDIKPANVLADPETSGVHLLGFGIASRLPRESQAPAPPEVIAGTLAYMAPEQTGYTNRSIDSRSDLYALGVTLYELWTGRLPFEASDPMEWIHCHVARQPVPPHELVKGIPRPVSEIVMKLLAKTAEKRYQTAAGLEADLQKCLDDWETTGTVGSFLLARRDTPAHLIVPEKLYGREQECKLLRDTLDRVATQGTAELVLISGYSGIGKSAVVNELQRSIVLTGGLFAAGKFDQYKRDVPYSTLAQAFQTLTRQILGKNEAEVLEWQAAIREAVGLNGQLIVDCIPEVELIIGPQPTVQDLPAQEAQNRFQTVFRKFLGVFARREHPLVLFLDDLQWLDAATLQLIESLFPHPEINHFLLIGAYRDNEVNASHPLLRMLPSIRNSGSVVHEIVLHPLTQRDVTQLVADALRCDAGLAKPLAEMVHDKTAGNPFFVIQFLTNLVDEHLVVFDVHARAWQWNLDRIRTKGFTDNVVDLLVEKLKRLPESTRETLQQMACLGNQAEIAMVAKVRQQSPEQVQTEIWEALKSGFLLRMNGACKFLHDRVQEAAYSLIPETRREEVHLRIGRLMAAGLSPEELNEHIFDVVNQFNRGSRLITGPRERIQVAEFNLRAGMRAKSSAAYASACIYFSHGRSLLGEDSWECHYDLIFGLTIGCAECEFLCGNLDAADALIQEVLLRARTNADKSEAYCLKVELHVMRSEIPQAVEFALDGLRMFGIDMPVHPSREQVQLEYDKVWQNLGGRSIESLVDLPRMTDADMQAALRLLSILYGPAYFTDVRLLCLYLCHMVNVSLKYGNSDASCAGYAWFGVILGSEFHRYEDGYRFGRLACELVEKHGLITSKANAYFSMELVVFWTQPAKAAIEFTRAAFKAGVESGDLAIACYSCNHAITDLLVQGSSLDEVWDEAERGFDFARRTKFRDAIDIIVSQRRFIQSMRGKTTSFGGFTDSGFDEEEFERSLTADRMPTMVCWYWILKLKARYFAGDYDAALAAAKRAELLLWSSAAHIQLLDYHYYTALTCAALAHSAAPQRRQKLLDELSTHLEQIRDWAEHCSATFLDKYLLVSAEVARLHGRDLEAMSLYEDAIRSARHNGFAEHEALGNELAGRFYGDRGYGTIASAYIRNARTCYSRWGALGKVAQLDEFYILPAERESLPPTATIGAPVEQLDLMTVMKATQAVSSEIVLEGLVDSLLRITVEHAGAERGLLLLPQNEGYWIAAEAVSHRNGVEIIPRQVPVTSSELSESILHYAIRTRKSVILQDTTAQSLFPEDEYVRRRRPYSILCLPLIKQACVTGVLYLENNLVSRAFTPNQITVLEMLASHAAISLDNARLYSDLRQENFDRRRTEEELQRSEAFLVQANAALQESQHLLQGILDHSTALIYIKDLRGRYLLMNRSCANMFHLRPEEVIGRTDYEFFAKEVADAFGRVDRRAIETGEVQEAEETAPCDDGLHTFLSIKVALGDDAGRPYAVCGISTDITERKRLEEQLRQSQKMEAVGGLAGGIAHDFNNLLGIILGYSDLLQTALRDDPPLLDKVEQISRAGERAAELIRKLLTFSRRQMLQPVTVDLNHVLVELDKMLRRVVTENIELELATGAESAVIRSDPGQIEQVVLNLVINARDAMPQGGRLVLTTSNVVLDHEAVCAHPQARPGPYIHLAVSDTGCGMDQATRSRIFEPFFTTKEPGKGTGLGLSTVYGIVEQACGLIEVESKPGSGSTFHLYLPQAEGQQSPSPKREAIEPTAGAGTILVVEDQDGLRQLMTEILQDNGYLVYSANNGEEALDICGTLPGSIDLLITDIVMPQMGGPELAKVLSATHPTTKVLFISGYSEHLLQQHERAQAGAAFLEKPFSPATMTRKVRQLLEQE